MMKATILGVAALASFVSATPASAVISTFAAFTPVSSARNVRWVNNGVAKTSAVNNTTTGTGGYLYTTSTATSNAPGIAKVNFEFFQLPLLGMMPANFFMDVTVTNKPAQLLAGIYIQQVVNGTFSFTSQNAFSVGATNYAAGTNLLTGTYMNAAIVGAGSSGSFSGNNTTVGSTLTYTSDVLDFSNVVDTDFSMSFTSLTPAFFRTATKALRSFRANAGGSFSSDPAPIPPIPEPEVWAMMVVGFGLIGVQVRRRARRTAVAA
jgi:hypothetical protein